MLRRSATCLDIRSHQLELNPGLTAVAGSDKSPGTTKIVGDGDTFKIGENIAVKCVGGKRSLA